MLMTQFLCGFVQFLFPTTGDQFLTKKKQFLNELFLRLYDKDYFLNMLLSDFWLDFSCFDHFKAALINLILIFCFQLVFPFFAIICFLSLSNDKFLISHALHYPFGRSFWGAL
ncbi:hypothetical protein S83_036351 [Arachis hypogaea]